MTFDVIVNSAVYEGDVFVFINMNMTHTDCCPRFHGV